MVQNFRKLLSFFISFIKLAYKIFKDTNNVVMISRLNFDCRIIVWSFYPGKLFTKLKVCLHSKFAKLVFSLGITNSSGHSHHQLQVFTLSLLKTCFLKFETPQVKLHWTGYKQLNINASFLSHLMLLQQVKKQNPQSPDSDNDAQDGTDHLTHRPRTRSGWLLVSSTWCRICVFR